MAAQKRVRSTQASLPMFDLISERAEAYRAQNALREFFARGATMGVQTLSTPGGPIEDANILIRRDLDLWAYFAKRANRQGLLLCWFGIGEPSWQSAIEINIPVRRTLHCYGQLVRDSSGETCLAHKGGLGGGKYTVAPGPFGDLIAGFEREVVREGDRNYSYFVLGRISNPRTLLRELSQFVQQAHHIRELRRNEKNFLATLKRLGGQSKDGKALGGLEYNDERTGKGAYSVQREVQFERIHGFVQKALARELRHRELHIGNRRQKHGLGPDLYVKDVKGRMKHLFEIKVGQDSQSTFTALGQLLVYSASENPSPIKTLVTRGLPKSEQFTKALKKEKIGVLYYDIDDKSEVEFFDLDDALWR
jgi:hypothetical protein